jgi:hypothetical protein
VELIRTSALIPWHWPPGFGMLCCSWEDEGRMLACWLACNVIVGSSPARPVMTLWRIVWSDPSRPLPAWQGVILNCLILYPDLMQIKRIEVVKFFTLVPGLSLERWGLQFVLTRAQLLYLRKLFSWQICLMLIVRVLLDFCAVWMWPVLPTFKTYVLPSSSGSKYVCRIVWFSVYT